MMNRPVRRSRLYKDPLLKRRSMHVSPSGESMYSRVAQGKGEVNKALQNFSEIVRRGKWLILSVLLLVLAGGAAYVSMLPPPVYQAHTLLLLDTQSSGGNDALNFGFIDGPSVGSKSLSNQVLILQQSLAIAEQTAARLIAMRTVPKTHERLTVLGPADAPHLQTNLAVLLQQRYITITPLKNEKAGADGIWVSAKSTVAGEAVLIANLYAEEYVKRTQETSRQRVSGSRRFLEEQKAKRQEELLRIEEQIKQMNQRGTIALDAETNRTISQVAQLEAALDEIRIEQSIKQASLASIERELQELHPKLTQRIASGVEKEIELTQEQLAQFEVQIEQIYQVNPSLREGASSNAELDVLNQRIAQLREHVRRLSTQYVDEILASGGINPKAGGIDYVARLNQQLAEGRIALSGMKAKVNALEQRLATYNRRLAAIPAQSMELAQLQRARQSAEQLYTHLVEKLQEARIAEESEIGFAQVLRPALHAAASPGPDKVQVLVLCTLLGLLLGVGAAFGRHKVDLRIYTPDDLREHNFRVLSVVPDMRPMIKKEFKKEAKVTYANRKVSTTLASLLRRHSPASESYRRLYLNLQFSRPDTVIQTVLIASSETGAGKSTTALNLAITAAQSGKHTLLVDADLHLPTLSDQLGLKPQRTLRSLLETPDADLQREHVATGIDNLYAIITREPVSNPTNLLGSKAMRDLIERFRQTYDLIIFDSPPVLVATDAALLATQCDATIVVASSGSTHIEALAQTTEELEGVGAQITGIVLNRFDPSQVYGYKYTYGYRYRIDETPYGHTKRTYATS